MNDANSLNKELSELKGFVADLKADRARQKESETRDAWTKYTSLSLVFIAVLTTVAAQFAGKYSGTVMVELNNATFYQAQASDEWSYYQASSIKEKLYDAVGELPGRSGAESEAAGSSRQETFKAKMAKYTSEKKETMDKARELEKKRDDARAAVKDAGLHGDKLGMAINLFQISIALGSICLMTKKRSLWYLSLVLAAAGTARMVVVLVQ